jgi:23S rRNA (pseudouridine1915-N3)-methyltransferase
MKIKVLVIGKTDDKNLQLLIDKYKKRLGHYIRFEIEVIPDLKNVKNLSEKEQKEKEGVLLLKKVGASDQLWLLDEKGQEFRSLEFSKFLQTKMNAGIKQLILVIGGPYGFSDEIYRKATGKLSLSKMTFSHQMIRLFLVEQIYRAFTILKNEPYHHE